VQPGVLATVPRLARDLTGYEDAIAADHGLDLRALGL
jgi:hypothetical protein